MKDSWSYALLLLLLTAEARGGENLIMSTVGYVALAKIDSGADLTSVLKYSDEGAAHGLNLKKIFENYVSNKSRFSELFIKYLQAYSDQNSVSMHPESKNYLRYTLGHCCTIKS